MVQLNLVLGDEVAAHCAVGNLSRLVKVSVCKLCKWCSVFVPNRVCVAQEARLTELKKEVDTLREELKASTDAVSVLNVSLGAAEEFVRKPLSCVIYA